MRRRDSNFELLRVLAIVMIVVFHYTWNADYTWQKMQGGGKLAIDVFYHFGELGVNSFGLLTGYFLSAQERPFRAQKAFLLWMQVLFYSVLSSAAYYTLKPEEFDLQALFEIIFPLSFHIWWYATAYLLLYFCAPFLNRLLNTLSRGEYRWLLVFQMTVFCILPTLLGVLEDNPEGFWYYSRFFWLIVLYCFAGYIRKYDPPFRLRTWKGWMLTHLALWAILIAFMAFWERFGDHFEEVFPISAIYFWRPNTVMMAALSVTLFLMCKNLRLRENRVINGLASATFGIYLFHGGRSGVVWWNRIFHNPAYEGTPMIFIDLLCAVAVILVLGLLVESVRKRLERVIIIPILRQHDSPDN